MEDKLGAFLQYVGLIALTIICGRGSLAAEEGHGPEDINFVIEEGESNTATFAPKVLSHEPPFEDITIRGKRTAPRNLGVPKRENGSARYSRSRDLLDLQSTFIYKALRFQHHRMYFFPYPSYSGR